MQLKKHDFGHNIIVCDPKSLVALQGLVLRIRMSYDDKRMFCSAKKIK